MRTVTQNADGVKPPANTDKPADTPKRPASRKFFDPTTFAPEINLIGELIALDEWAREPKTLSCRSFPKYLKFALKACRQEAHDRQLQKATSAKEVSQHDALAICVRLTVSKFFTDEDCKRLADARVELVRLMRHMENIELAELIQVFVDKFCFTPPTTPAGSEQLKANILLENYKSLAGAKAKLGIPMQTLAIVSVAMAVEQQAAPNPKHVELAHETVQLFFKTVGDYRSFIEAFVSSQKDRSPSRLRAVP